MRSCIHTGEISCSVTAIEAVSFIHLDPSNRSTIYNALLSAVEECKRHNQATIAPPGELDSVTLQLGGFHLLVSFMGSIEFVMSGSDIEELWMQVYAKSSVTHMISDHAVFRAVRAHMLTSMYQEELHKLFLDVSTGEEMIPDAVESPVLVSFLASFERKYKALSEQSRTGKLWVQYLRQVDILRLFIRVERSGDWELHLQGVQSMLPHLHAAEHFHYAKSVHLYVQQIEELPSRIPPHEYNKFTSEVFFTVRRKKDWEGVWTDLSMEQNRMCALKTKGRLTRRRGITESTLAYFGAAFPIYLKLCNALEELSGIKAESSEQHVELRDSRRIRDARDVAVLLINCDGLGAIIGSNFGEVKLTQKNRVKPLSAVARSILIRVDVVEANSHQLFMWIVCVMKIENDLKHYLSYELFPRPPAPFDESNQLPYSCSSEGNSTHGPRRRIIDGGHLLHALAWPGPATYGQIANAYLEFVQKHYRVSVTVVFDCYNHNTSRFLKQSSPCCPTILKQQKSKCAVLRAMLILIVKRALELASVRNNVTVVASDTDIVVMMLARTTDDMELKVLSPGTNTQCDKVYNVREIQEKIGKSKDSIHFCHAVTGCDTASAFFGKGKKKVRKILQKPA
ncbi:hypothetical protein PR048_023566 [Dryococelus australis]|uniref:Uncharacterized protein n=1 Tax=Dryococelus australis TaxID=614101 RepID=A0ABQ9GUF9_9NEOP|nr:hypothetical protein PR048_023566 [Dryococelus australis]